MAKINASRPIIAGVNFSSCFFRLFYSLSMKRFMLLTFPLVAAATAGSAQVSQPQKPTVAPPGKAAPKAIPASAEERVNALTASMTQALSLTPAQTEKVRDVNAKAVRSGEAARQRYADNPAKFHSSIEEITLARLEQLKDVLTPAQFNRYQQKREEKLGVPTVRGYQGTPPPGMSNGRGGDE